METKVFEVRTATDEEARQLLSLSRGETFAYNTTETWNIPTSG